MLYIGRAKFAVEVGCLIHKCNRTVQKEADQKKKPFIKLESDSQC